MIEPTVFGDPVDEGALRQIENCLRDERAVAGAMMADHHLGYGCPIGGVIAYDRAISPSGVGFDIACGNMAVRTTLRTGHLGTTPVGRDETIKGLMREVQKKVAFGMGRSNPTPVDNALFDHSVWPELERRSPGLKQKAQAQLGTVGSGNHYVDLLIDENGALWIANHFGSRGLGHTIASGFMSLAAGRAFNERVPEGDEPIVFATDSEIGAFYLECMQLAGLYAYAGREYVIEQVLGILGAAAIEEVHNHHNYAWYESGLWVVRKGATPLSHAAAFIGGSMGEDSVIVRGTPVDPANSMDQGIGKGVAEIGALGSAPHGAGRQMSRTAAAGKMRKMWVCADRDCRFQPERAIANAAPTSGGRCPICNSQLRKLRIRDTSTAQIDWDSVRQDLRTRGICVLGAGADEAPGAYKDLSEVLGHHPNIEVLHTLSPIGVVMAGPDVKDPYKD